MDGFNKKRIRFSSEVNMYEKFIKDFINKELEKSSTLRGKQQSLGDPTV